MHHIARCNFRTLPGRALKFHVWVPHGKITDTYFFSLQIMTIFGVMILLDKEIPYFFGYKMEFFSFQNNPKDQDLSYKTDLDLWDCLGRVKLRIIAKFHRNDLVI